MVCRYCGGFVRVVLQVDEPVVVEEYCVCSECGEVM